MLTTKETQLIAQLRKNARNNLTNISKIIQMPVSTIFDRIKKYEGDLITKHCSLINFEKFGYATRANITLKVKREQRDQIREHLLKHFNVNSLYRINNGYDFMVETVFRNINEMEEFLETLEERFTIRKKDVYYIINEIKREAFMSNEITADQILQNQKT